MYPRMVLETRAALDRSPQSQERPLVQSYELAPSALGVRFVLGRLTVGKAPTVHRMG